MKVDQLTTKKIERYKDPGKYSDGRNLYLHVGKNGSKSWLFIYRREGKDKMRGLGSLKAIGLAEAREKAAEYRAMLRRGEEPPVYRGTFKKPEAGRTFKDITERYIAAHRETWRNPKSEAQWRSSLTQYAYPVMGDMDVGDIGVSHVHEVLEPIWTAKHDTAKKVRGRMGLILGYAAGLDLRPDLDLTRSGGKLDHLLPKSARLRRTEGHASLPYAELPTFMDELRKRDGIAAGALEFLILTAARTTEVLEARWREVDLDAGVWTVPADRMKAGREHRVPLTPAALAVLKSQPRDKGEEFIFISQSMGGGTLTNMAMTALLKRMGRKDGVTVHGFRSTFRTWAAEQCLDVPREIAEAALAHTVGGVEGAYQRGDYWHTRRTLMERFAAYCDGEVA
ncbi:site-specific integrase [Sphingomonas sp.]|jgi:integrase|uniref:tyrosine-type recombinase/integrase n=1 Tax=Sphingomonas sp. TaxID=28214 RepID=UPI00260C1506|nr:site-specific integrase [Sphingomonas sp.]MDF2493697.1 putative phage integrase [Sphingomonas sp.]